MKKCKCGSYAVNIERLTGEKCDVCHYKSQVEALRTENAKLIAERDEYHRVLDASDRKLLDRLLAERDEAQSDNESLEDKLQEQMNLVGSLLVEREQWMKQEPLDITDGLENPMSLRQCLKQLVRCAEILLDERCYDGHGHEVLSEAKNRAYEYLSAAPQPGDKP